MKALRPAIAPGASIHTIPFLLGLRVFLTMVVRIATSSLASSMRGANRVATTISVAASKRSQYSVSRASLQAMEYFDVKSARLWLACPSSTFAPIDVPDRNNWRDRVRGTHGVRSSTVQSLTIRSAKSNVRGGSSLGASLLSLFTLHPWLFTTSPFVTSAIILLNSDSTFASKSDMIS